MKRLLYLLPILLSNLAAQSQVPDKFSYQAVIRNSANALVINQAVGVRISILQSSISGPTVYAETHNTTSNINGLISIEIGGGVPQTGSINNINWGNGPYYIKTEVDPTGGVAYSINGTSQLLSVPYAFYSAKASNVSDSQQLTVSNTGDSLKLQNGGFVIIPGISAANTPGTLPTLSTVKVTAVTTSSAVSGGTVTNNGGRNIIARGIVWSTSPNPTISNKLGLTSDGSDTGSYTSNITGLSPNTFYYVRAYATNSVGTAYGGQDTFRTATGTGVIVTNGPVLNYNGHNYKTIILGNGRVWMAENLRTSSYRNGDPIPIVTGNTEWSNLTTGAWCHYQINSNYDSIYGKLYNWFVVSDSRKVCPLGWYVPSFTDWDSLIYYLGGNTVAGGKMKMVGTQYWFSPNSDATNESAFSALPGGYRTSSATFLSLGYNGIWWSSTLTNGIDDWAINLGLNYTHGRAIFANPSRKTGVSIRCVKDK